MGRFKIVTSTADQRTQYRRDWNSCTANKSCKFVSSNGGRFHKVECSFQNSFKSQMHLWWKHSASSPHVCGHSAKTIHHSWASIGFALNGQSKVRNDHSLNPIKKTKNKTFLTICHSALIAHVPKCIFLPPTREGVQKEFKKQTYTQSDPEALAEQIRSAAHNPMNSCLQQG